MKAGPRLVRPMARPKDNEKKTTPGETGPEDTEIVPAADLDLAREADAPKPPRPPANVFINTLNVFAGPMSRIYDPIRKVCYEPLQTHWEERYKKRSKHPHTMLILDMALLALVGTLVVGGIFAYFVLPAFPQPQVVNLQTLSPAKLVSGGHTEFVIAYRNETGRPMASAELRVNLPEGFVADKAAEAKAGQAQPAAVGARVLVYPLGTLAPNGRGEIRIPGTVYGPIGAKKVLASDLLFWQEGQTAPSRTASYTEWLIEDSLLSLDLRLSEQFVRGRQTAVTIAYSNKGDQPIEAAVVRLSAPDDFIISGAEPRMSGRNEWLISDLEGKGSGLITVYGRLRSGGPQAASPSFTLRGYVIAGGERYLTQETRRNIAALTGGFELSQEISSPAGSQSLAPGENVTVTLRYRNAGGQPIDNVRITLEPTPSIILPPETPFFWDASRLPELRRLEPGASGEITAGFRLKGAFAAEDLGGQPYPVLDIAALAEYDLAGDTIHPVHVDAAGLSMPVATVLGIKAAAMYYTKDGEQLGVGPLPPRAGQPTKYWVFIYLTNTTSAVRDAKVEAALPTNVAWTGKYSVTSGQSAAYLPSTGTVQWDAGLVPVGADGSIKVGLSFEVELTPDKTDIGKIPVLLKDIKVTGADSVTGARVGATAPDITADLQLDERAAGKGKVVK